MLSRIHGINLCIDLLLVILGDVGLWGDINESDNMIMCVKGHPGFGKSTLLAKFVSDLIKVCYMIVNIFCLFLF
jgi:predicted ATP-dependent serine protease